MTNEQAIIQLTAIKGQHENDSEALGIALELLTTGYKSDQEANRVTIESGVAAGIVSAVAAATAPLNELIATDKIIIADLQRQINALAPAAGSAAPLLVEGGAVDIPLQGKP